MADLVPSDSPLKNPPRDLEADQKVALDGVRYAMDMAHLSYRRLLADLLDISLTFKAGATQNAPTTEAFADAWAFVDALHRLRLLILKVPLLKRTPPLKAHLRALHELVGLRDGFQHLDERIQLSVSESFPLWGSLAWLHTADPSVEAGTLFIAASGSFRTSQHLFVNPLGREFEVPVGLIVLQAFGKELDLSALAQRLTRLAGAFDKSVRQAIGSQPGGGTDLIMMAEIEYVDVEPPDGAA